MTDSPPPPRAPSGEPDVLDEELPIVLTDRDREWVSLVARFQDEVTGLRTQLTATQSKLEGLQHERTWSQQHIGPEIDGLQALDAASRARGEPV